MSGQSSLNQSLLLFENHLYYIAHMLIAYDIDHRLINKPRPFVKYILSWAETLNYYKENPLLIE